MTFLMAEKFLWPGNIYAFHIAVIDIETKIVPIFMTDGRH